MRGRAGWRGRAKGELLDDWPGVMAALPVPLCTEESWARCLGTVLDTAGGGDPTFPTVIPCVLTDVV